MAVRIDLEYLLPAWEKTSEKTLSRFYQSPIELPTAKLSVVLV
ncbi:MAG: hypothetical protein ACRC62_25275 [Microcoleus sp.]